MLFHFKILGNLDHLINQVAKVALSTTEESCQLFCCMFADWLKSASVAVDHSRLVFHLQVFADFFLPNLSQEQSTGNTEKKKKKTVLKYFDTILRKPFLAYIELADLIKRHFASTFLETLGNFWD